MKIKFSIIFLIVIAFATSASAERLAISAPVANIRSGPGVSHEILWKVEKYFPILVIEKSGQWYHFEDFEGDKGWVHESPAISAPAPARTFLYFFLLKKEYPLRSLNAKAPGFTLNMPMAIKAGSISRSSGNCRIRFQRSQQGVGDASRI
jgi:uncharacterized protein YgiM (DUF1202 family)